ncbi:CAP domain-containing protein [Nonomuraea sp. NPDC005650]|uniref:CAP domain-containing protein n=1 Tax=Nonomuraea sp. NPDC005650 TaxID=3157045 RepID=UPI0033AEDE0C
MALAPTAPTQLAKAATRTTAAPVAAAPTCDSTFNLQRYSNESPWNEVTNPRSRIAVGANSRMSQAVGCLINAERARQGLPALVAKTPLDRAAQKHARESAALQWWDKNDGRGTHNNPSTKSTPETRIRAAGYCPNPTSWAFSEITYAGAQGRGTPSRAVNWWVNVSDRGHREIVLDPSMTHFGYWATGRSAHRDEVGLKDGGTFVVTFGRCQQ